MNIINLQKAKLERNRLIIDENVTLEEWKEIGQTLKQVEGSVQFWIGDWARFGEKQGFTGKYVSPKVYDELEEITGYTRGAIKNLKSIAQKTEVVRESSSMDDDVKFSHIRAVSSLSVNDQKQFIRRVSDEKISIVDLREEVKQFKTNKENEMTQDNPTKENAPVRDYSHIENLRRLNAKRALDNEIIAIAKDIKKKYKKEQIQFLINILNK